MTYTFKLSRRIARLRALTFFTLISALGACDNADSFAPSADSPSSTSSPALHADAPSLAVAYAGGIPFGTFRQPTTEFGSRFNGAMRTIYPQFLLKELADIKARGGKVALMMVGPESNYKDADGHFSLTKWKARMDQFKGVDFSAYVNDGTIIGHYLIDEPQDAFNWNGQPISPETLEAMAQYSKQRWPNMVTIVRTWPDYLDNWSGTYRYLDAAWAQYAANRWPDAEAFLATNVAKAKAKNLALIVGLNLIDGSPTKGQMSASQLRSYGAALLGDSYPCAFISWQYRDEYMNGNGILDAMSYLRGLAQNRGFKSCRASAVSSPSPTPPPPAPDPSVTSPLPFGLFQAPVDEYTSQWTGSLYRAEPSDLVQRLTRAETAKMKIVVNMAWPAQSKNPDGTFSLTKWKAQVDRFRTLALGHHISAKTLYAHSLIDQPNCASCWGGQAVSWETLEEMARYSKSIWPSLPTTARVAPSALAAASFRWTYLDAGWAQYSTRLGDVRTWLANQVRQAKAEGLGLMVGLNLVDGSGFNTAPMTATQIKELGSVLAKEPAVCALVGWRYDASLMNQSAIRDALGTVAAAAKSRNAAPCVVS
jgi:hypothetical protein